jgi:hypothetical protein
LAHIAAAVRAPDSGARATALRCEVKTARKEPLTEELKVNLSLMRSLLGASKRYSFKLATALTMSSTGSGLINSSVSAATATTVAEFSPLSSLFNEFFIVDFTLKWMPAFMNTGILGAAVASANTLNLPIGVASYHHNAVLPTSLSGLTTNPTFRYFNSGVPFSFTWRNVESPDSDVVVVSNPTSTTPSQGWCLTASDPAESYTGQALILSNSSPSMSVGTVLGSFVYTATVLFRTRV